MTPHVVRDSNEDTSAAGLAAVQEIFDDAMRRLAAIYEDWQQFCREALQETPPQAAVADPAEPGTAEVPQAA